MVPDTDRDLTYAEMLTVLTDVDNAGYEVIKTEHLYTFDGEAGYSLGQGQ